jgi:hypothetical protein
MIRFVIAVLALTIAGSPTHAVECGQPVSGQNQVCLDPETPIVQETPTKRSRVFSMNGRTTDKDIPATGYKAVPNIFWTFRGPSVGNWGNPKVTLIEYSGGVPPKNTQVVFSVDGSYGTRGGSSIAINIKLFDLNGQLIKIKGTDVQGHDHIVDTFALASMTMKCSVDREPRRNPERPLQAYGTWLNELDKIRLIELQSVPADAPWSPC